jgi:hypothetical protein
MNNGNGIFRRKPKADARMKHDYKAHTYGTQTEHPDDGSRQIEHNIVQTK